MDSQTLLCVAIGICWIVCTRATYHCSGSLVVEWMLCGVQTRDVLDAMKDDADFGSVDRLKVDGGASNNDLLMEIQAEALQVQSERSKH